MNTKKHKMVRKHVATCHAQVISKHFFKLSVSHLPFLNTAYRFHFDFSEWRDLSLMADSDPWDDSDQHEIPQTARRHQRSLRASHLHSQPPHSRNPSNRRSRIGDDLGEKVQDLTSSLRATSEVLSTADRMLEHYRCINDDQDEEIRRVCELQLYYATNQWWKIAYCIGIV